METPKSLSDLPTEILLQIIAQVDDVYEYISLSQVCKTFQRIIRQLVLVCGDSPYASGFFNSIADEYLYMDTIQDGAFKDTIRKFQMFIFEFSQESKSIPPDSYLMAIAKCKRSARQKIVEVFLTQRAAEMAFADRGNVWIKHDQLGSVPEETKKYHYYMSQVALTLFMDKSDLAVNTFTNNQNSGFGKDLIRFGHEYEFRNVKELPHFYFSLSSFYDFKIRSKSLEKLDGLTSSDMAKPRLPPLLKFLELSYLPNLREIKGIAIESGLSLSVFERFDKLEVLHLQSAYTGNVELQISHDKKVVELKNLKELTIHGNSVSLYNTSFPSLQQLEIHVHGAFERGFSESLFFEKVTCPSLECLDLEITSIPTGLPYLLQGLSPVLKQLKDVELTANSKSFILANDLINQLEAVKSLLLVHNDLEINDLPQGPQRENYTLTDADPPFILNLPSLNHLTLVHFDKFNKDLLQGRTYPCLEHLAFTIKIKTTSQRYVFDTEHFPSLKELSVDYTNSYAHLQKCNVSLVIDVPNLGMTFLKQIPDAVEYKQPPRNVWVYVVE